MNYQKYFEKYNRELLDLLNQVDSNLIKKCVEIIKKIKKNNNTIFIVGNGGSASIASHVSVDFSKAAKIKSLTFNNSNLITCFANDYGHENWIKEAIKTYCSKKDLLILISSSGRSPNIINAAKYCKSNNINLITFSGFNKNNRLSKLGNINFHINSKNYNYIEMTHHIILVSLVDIISEGY
tara:strand:+ start:224 stop:769 length:546 start_codon:yes stop_codon:yes gene_type:complete